MKTGGEKKSLVALIRDELGLLLYDKWLLVGVSLLPVGLFVFMFCLFQQGIVRELPIAVVDLDKGQLSRMLTRTCEASSHLQVICYPTLEEAIAAMRRTKVYGAIVIPAEMEKKLRLAQSPTIHVFYNFQFVLVGKALKSAVATAHANFNAQVATLAGLGKGNVQISQSMGAAVVTRKQITPLFNLAMNYGQFLVTSLVPTLWQILMVVVMVLVWAAEARRSSLVGWLREQPVARLCVRFGCYHVFFLLQGVFFLMAFVGSGWPARGNLFELLVAQSLAVLACQAIGTVFFLSIPDTSRSLSLAVSYVAPSFAFLGVTFPATDMNFLARLWHSVLPVSYYMKIQIGLLNHEASFASLRPHFLKLCCLLLFFVLIAIVISKRRIACPKGEEDEMA